MAGFHGHQIRPPAAMALSLWSEGCERALVTIATCHWWVARTMEQMSPQHSVGFAGGDKFGHRLGYGFSFQHRKER